ncbi:YdeI family protein [Pseudoruegeria sp. HB172150]|uniref:YdeI/OmpD-associated family protein n=1 Tax=Pseudoruegeria sp. HB172150 TaxID=2721164 RepID=UPI00155384D3|nr:YdeI/OmpD-associated family protein [Pseudoruegeria sp. HB172150]
MGKPDRRVGVYYEQKASKWVAEQKAFRAILLDSPLDEAFKWRSPVYTWDGRNVSIVWGFNDHCALGFFKGVLLKDPEGILVAPGENSRSSRMIAVTSTEEIEKLKPTILAYIDEAIELEKSGAKVDFPKDDLDYPQELVDRLDEDPELREAFENLTPGRRRGYVLHFSQAKQSATRTNRIEKFAPRILEGKGMQDR